MYLWRGILKSSSLQQRAVLRSSCGKKFITSFCSTPSARQLQQGIIRSLTSTSQMAQPDTIAAALKRTQKLVAAATDIAKTKGTFVQSPQLVAVSKTKPAEAILEAYAAGQRHFGENYVQELVTKANDPNLPKDIKWHFIGTLQSNKAKLVAGISTISLIETITSVKLANALEKALVQNNVNVRDDAVNVLVQINTSAEDNKGGVNPGDDAVALASHIVNNCPHLRFSGIMTIGQYGRVTKPGESNPDFVALIKCRDDMCISLGISKAALQVSMGMSGDFEHAIELGATSVRVGSAIFGAREYENK